jgi:hypothetical protein
MKLFFTAVALLLILFTSCKKRECECPCLVCETTYTDQPGRTSVDWTDLCRYEHDMLVGNGVDMRGLLAIQTPDKRVECKYE